MKNKKTLYQFILDSSGSMSKDRDNTVRMFNRQVSTIKSLSRQYPDQTFLTGLTVFNERAHPVLHSTPANLLKELNFERYNPMGFTALYDAIGETIENINERFGMEINSGNMSVVMVILTDGHENSSRRYDMITVAELIKKLEDSNNWNFNILGADFDITSVASLMNFREKSSLNYSKSDFKKMEDDIGMSIRNYAFMKSKGIVLKDFFQ